MEMCSDADLRSLPVRLVAPQGQMQCDAGHLYLHLYLHRNSVWLDSTTHVTCIMFQEHMPSSGQAYLRLCTAEAPQLLQWEIDLQQESAVGLLAPWAFKCL